jgi:hypothetical protein
MASLQKENAELRQEVARLQETLVRIVTLPPPPDFLNLPAIETHVQNVDRKRKRVTLHINREQKVDVGMRFFIARGLTGDSAYVGEVMVIEVRPDQCIAVILTLKPGMNIQVGDYAATRL